MNIYDMAAQSVLRGDQHKNVEFGGQRYNDIDRVEADEEAVTVIDKHGNRSGCRIPAQLIFVPGNNRSMAPADVYQAVEFAFKEAHKALSRDVS